MSDPENCTLSGTCEFADICNDNDSDFLHEAIMSSPEVQILAPDLEVEEITALARPAVEAWHSDRCLKEKVRALKGLQFEDDISHVSITMGHSVLARIDELLGVS